MRVPIFLEYRAGTIYRRKQVSRVSKRQFDREIRRDLVADCLNLLFCNIF